ncbi:hypothetical protein KNP414_05523 [Paenibacillus mucilaginosus KNP414]|nr:hypothetical protein KNP414_05523 [Paenibacillus mucilaginosus KNP414]
MCGHPLANAHSSLGPTAKGLTVIQCYYLERKEAAAMGCVGGTGGVWTSTGVILVLFILLVIVSKAFI